jgi:hypothetical protein
MEERVCVMERKERREKEREGELDLGALYKRCPSIAARRSHGLSAMSYFILLGELGLTKQRSNVGLAGRWRGRCNTDRL